MTGIAHTNNAVMCRWGGGGGYPLYWGCCQLAQNAIIYYTCRTNPGTWPEGRYVYLDQRASGPS